MIYQSTLDNRDYRELCDNFFNKKAPYGNVSVICHKMLSVVLFSNSQSLFFSRYKYLFGLPSLCCFLLITILDN